MTHFLNLTAAALHRHINLRMVGLFVLCSITLLSVSPSQAGELIPRKVIFGNPERAFPLISPDGRSLAFLAPVNGVMNVVVSEIGDVAGAKPVTSETARPIRKFLWALNGRHILYLQDQGGNENYHLFSVDRGTAKITDLTPSKNTRAEILAVSYRNPDEILVGLNNRDAKWHDVWRINVVTGQGRLIEKNDGYAGYVADEDFNLRLALKPTADGGTHVFKRANSAWTSFFKISADDDLSSKVLGYSGDGRTFFMLDSRGRDKSAVVAVDAETGAVKIVGRAANADVANVIFDPTTNAVLAFGAEYERPIWTAVDSALKADLSFLKKHIGGVWSVLSQTRDNSVWTLRIDNIVEPVKFAAYDRKAKTLTTLFVSRPTLNAAPLSLMIPVVIRSRDGLGLVSYLTLPKGSDINGDGRPEVPLPMVLSVHGGPWDRNKLGYDPEHQWLANRGYAVLSVNYRGSTGFGKAFINAGDREWAGKMHDDLIDAVEWAVDHGVARQDKMAIYGGSYGGYAALVGMSFTPKTFACGASIVGHSNLNTLIASIPPYWASFMDTVKRRIGDPTTVEGRKLLTERSPLFKASKIERPLLIAQGANDPRVNQIESDQIVAAMKGRNVAVTYILYADEGHGLTRPANRLSFYAVFETFLAKCLGGRSEPLGNDFKGSSISSPAGKEYVPGLKDALSMTKP